MSTGVFRQRFIPPGQPQILSAFWGKITHALTADGISASSHVLDSPDISQVHALASDNISLDEPDLDSPVLQQVHVLSGATIDAGAHTLGTPVATLIMLLTGDSLSASAHVLDEPELTGNIVELAASALSATAHSLDSPVLAQVHSLASAALSLAAHTLGSTALTQVHVLAATAISGELKNIGTVQANGAPSTPGTYDPSTGVGSVFRDDPANVGYIRFVLQHGRTYSIDIQNQGSATLALRETPGGSFYGTVSAGQRKTITFVANLTGDNMVIDLGTNSVNLPFTLHSLALAEGHVMDSPVLTQVHALAALGIHADLTSTGFIAETGSATDATFDTDTGVGTASRTDLGNQSYVKFPLTVGVTYAIDIENTGATALVLRIMNGGTVYNTVLAGVRTQLSVTVASGTHPFVIAPSSNGQAISFKIHSLGLSLPAKPSLDTPVMTVVSLLNAAALDAAGHVLGSPALAQAHALTASDIDLLSHLLGSPVITQGNVLSADSLSAAAHLLGTPLITVIEGAIATGIDVGPHTLGSPLLSQVHSLVGGSISYAILLDSPALHQVHSLSADDLDLLAHVLGSPFLFAPTGIYAKWDAVWQQPVVYGKHDGTWKQVVTGYRYKDGEWTTVYVAHP